MNAITAAKLEADGKGAFSVAGRTVTFRANDGLTFTWSAKSTKEAASQLRLFRAATKYEFGAAHG